MMRQDWLLVLAVVGGLGLTWPLWSDRSPLQDGPRRVLRVGLVLIGLALAAGRLELW
jgi:hypothetical protein